MTPLFFFFFLNLFFLIYCDFCSAKVELAHEQNKTNKQTNKHKMIYTCKSRQILILGLFIY